MSLSLRPREKRGTPKGSAYEEETPAIRGGSTHSLSETYFPEREKSQSGRREKAAKGRCSLQKKSVISQHSYLYRAREGGMTPEGELRREPLGLNSREGEDKKVFF